MNRIEYVFDCSALLNTHGQRWFETWTLLEMREAYQQEIPEAHPRGQYLGMLHDDLAIIEELLSKKPDYEEQWAKFQRERQALAESLMLRGARWRFGSKGPKYHELLEKRLGEMDRRDRLRGRLGGV